MTTAERDGLVRRNLRLVRALAVAQWKTHRNAFDLDDLIGYGMIGLVQAAQRFDPHAGATFATFAYQRVAGAIVDGMRQMGTLTRASIARYKADPSKATHLDSFDGAAAKRIADGRPLPSDEIERAQDAAEVRAAVARLPERERRILEDSYFHGRTLEDIGADMGLTKSWACRLREGAVGLLAQEIARTA